MVEERTYNDFVKAFMDGVKIPDTHLHRVLYLRDHILNKKYSFPGSVIKSLIDIMLIDSQMEAMSMLRGVVKTYGDDSIQYNAITYLLTGNITFKYSDL